ncbi:MAG: Holliday junction branch migration DNA helicase RuvB [Fibrobacterota bacterium]
MDEIQKGILSSRKNPEDDFELSVRPSRLESFIGHSKLKENLKVFLAAAKKRGEPLDHVILAGPPGLGKTTLANIIAAEMGVKMRSTSGPVLTRAGDLAGLLTNLAEGDVLFIDEIHSLNRTVEEYIYSAMEDFQIDILIENGPNARSVKLDLKKFTLVGATTRVGMLTSPMLARFGMNMRVDYYPPAELCKIICRSAGILGIKIAEEAALEIGKRSRGTPRIANRLLRRARDFAQIEGSGEICPEIALMTLERLGVDKLGLDDIDKRIVKDTIIDKYSGGPVGLKTIAVAVGEAPETVESVYEPYLIQSGFLKRTSRGREATGKAYTHFGLSGGPDTRQADLF